MDTGELRVVADRRGPVCRLSVAGELDATSADEFLRYVVQVVNERTQRLVLNLAGLRFVDCCGAQALRAAALAAPENCPVIVRSVSPSVRRVFRLLGLDLEDQHNEAELAAARVAEELVAGARRVRSRWQGAAKRAERVAEAIADTEDRVAATMISVAAQRPDVADRLLALSEAARGHAARSRRWADDHRRPAGRLS